MKTKKDLLICLVICVALFGIFIFVRKILYKGYDSRNEACKAGFGQNYRFVEGKVGPDMCISSDGIIRYYEAIPAAE